jgi:hypothetical protein
VKLTVQQWTSFGLALLAVCSVAAVLLTRSAPGTTERTERARNLIPIFRESEVGKLTFTSRGKSFRLERVTRDGAAPRANGDDFELYAPDREPADGAAVDRVISGLGFATPVRRLDGGDLAAFGLLTPEVTLDLAMGDSALRIALGKNAPSPAGAAYVKVTGAPGGDVLAVVSKDVAALLRFAPDDFRERALLGLGRNDVKELALERQGATLRLVRAGASFRIDEKERANRDVLEPVFQALSRLDARRFLAVPEAEKARGAPAALVVRVTPVDAKDPAKLVELGGSCPGHPDEVLAIVRSPRARAGCVERTLLGALTLEREALFDEQPFAARPDEVETLTIERDGRRLVLARRGSAWLLREPSEAQVALEAGNERLAAILGAEATVVRNPDLRRLGLDPALGHVVITRLGEDDKAVDEKLELGRKEADGTLHVRRADDGAVLSLGRDAARAFTVDTTLLKSLRIADFSLSALAELELTAPEHQLLRRAPSGFTLVEPRGHAHDGALATDAVLAFGSLTALRFVADADDGTFGLGTPTLVARARFDADGGTNTLGLVVGRSTPGGFFAKLESDPSVFVIERSVAERLGTLLVDRSAFMADPKTLARVTISANGVTRTLERRHDELVAAASSDIDATVVARLIEALGALRAEAAVHTGGPRPDEGFAKPKLRVRFEPLAGLGKSRSFEVGASGAPGGPLSGVERSAHFARAEGVDATFLLADAKLKPLFDLF